jgi:pimeloyl-ACP methyl ester carboxylesterase
MTNAGEVVPGTAQRDRCGNLYLREAGSGAPILLIHGSGFDASTWGQTYDELARNHQVVACNRRGYRFSGVETRRWSDHAQDAAELLRSLHARSATVVGHSAGAIVALEMAVRRPESVSALILLDPAIYVKRYGTADFAWAFLASQSDVEALAAGDRGSRRVRSSCWWCERRLARVRGQSTNPFSTERTK